MGALFFLRNPDPPLFIFLTYSQKVKVSIRGAGVWKKSAQCQVLVCLRKNDELGRSNFQVRKKKKTSEKLTKTKKKTDRKVRGTTEGK